MWSVCRNLQSHHLGPSWSKMPWQAALLLHPAHLPQKRACTILGNKWSAVDMRVLTPVNINGSFVHILIANEAQSVEH